MSLFFNPLYPRQQSDITLPGSILLLMTFNNVGADRSETATIKTSRVSRHMPPNTHCSGKTRPTFFLLENKASTISTVNPSLPIFPFFFSIQLAQASRKHRDLNLKFTNISNSWYQSIVVFDSYQFPVKKFD